MKRHLHTKSALSTNVTSPFQTPLKGERHQVITPVILKQKLLFKSKEKPIIHIKTTCRTKEKPIYRYGQLASRNQVNWIIYNILVGIYRNWLRLAPYVLRYLTHTRDDMLKDVQKMIQNAIKQKQRIQSLLKKFNPKISQTYSSQNPQKPSQQQPYQLLQHIHSLCNQIKLSTQLLSGQMIIQKRTLKTQRQNQLADKIFENLDKNKNKKILVMNDNISKLVDTIIDRIAVVKYMKQNNMKINQNLLKPLKNIFMKDSSFDEVNNMTIDKVLEKIKAKFSINQKQQQNKKQNNRQKISSKITLNQNNKQNIYKAVDNKMINNQTNDIQQKTQSKIPSQQSNNLQIMAQKNKTSNQIPYQRIQQQCELFQSTILSNKSLFDLAMKSQRQFKSKKKLGIYLQSQQDQSSGQHYEFTNNKSKKYLQKLNQRKIVMQREQKRKKNRMNALINDMKLQNNVKKSQIFQQDQKNQKNKIKIKPSKIYEVKQKSKYKIKDMLLQKDKNISSKPPQKQQILKKNIQNNRNISISSIVQNQSQSDQQSNDNNKLTKKILTNPRNYIKPAKLLRKRLIKKKSNLFDSFDLQNFDSQLQAQSNVVNKKRKILNLFKNLQNSGLINLKSIKKIVANAKKLQSQFIITANKPIKRQNTCEQIPITSFFMIPNLQSPQKQTQQKYIQCNPYKYLTIFNKQALQHWFTSRIYRNTQILKLQQIQKQYYHDNNFDIKPMRRQQVKNNRKYMNWIDKQMIALDLAFKWNKIFNNNIIKQQNINIQKQFVIA